MSHKILIFLKFGSEKHIFDFYENGNVYINTIEYFRKFEDEELRGDKYEGASRIINSLPGNFFIPALNHTVNYEKVHIKETYETVVGNLFCLYCISSHGFPDIYSVKIDERNRRFGTHCIMIKQPGVFINKLELALERAQYKFYHNLVKYYDKSTFNGKLCLFDKSLEFEHQKEFRFLVESEILEPFKLNIGDVKEYCEVFRTEDIMQMQLVKSN